MNLLIWLDLPLMALGLLAMAPGFWYLFCLRQIVLGRGVRTALSLVFSLGLGAFTVAGVDAGLAQWDKARRVQGSGDTIGVSKMAPDFALSSPEDNHTIRLSDFRGHKPVVLIFGNFY